MPPTLFPSICFIAGTCIYLAIRGWYQRKARSSPKAIDRKSSMDQALVLAVVFGQIVLPLTAIFSPLLQWAAYAPPTPTLAWCGATVMVAGIYLFWRAHADLGTNWSVSLELGRDHTLVTRGVFKSIRHPMYASFFVMAAGQWLLLSNWVAGPSALAAVSVLYLARKPREEAMMLEHFGSAYSDYMKSTGGIIPRWQKT